MNTVDVMVLNDGETYTAVNGCKIVRVNANDLKADERAAIDGGEVLAALAPSESFDDALATLSAGLDYFEEHGDDTDTDALENATAVLKAATKITTAL
jgi:alkylhydroperoxidase family enzyme